MKGIFEKKEHFGLKAFRANGFQGFSPMFHTHGELIYVVRGSIPMVVDGKEFELKEGEMSVLFPYLVHSYEEMPETEAIVVLFDPSETAFYTEFVSRKPVRSYVRGEEFLPLLERLLYFRKKGDFPTAFGYLSALIGEFLDRVPVVRSDRSVENAAIRVLEYCGEHFAEDITVKTVSSALYVSQSYISKIFSEKLRYGFREYINSLRIQKAKTLLEHGNQPIVEIMLDCGFRNQSSFNRVFRDLCGTSPGDYRKEVHGDEGKKL